MSLAARSEEKRMFLQASALFKKNVLKVLTWAVELQPLHHTDSGSASQGRLNTNNIIKKKQDLNTLI